MIKTAHSNSTTDVHTTNAFINSIESYIKTHVSSNIKNIEKNGVTKSLWKEMGDFGLLGITMPISLGGLGQSYALQAYVIEYLSRYSPSLGLSYLAHSHLCMNQILCHGNEHQQQAWLPKLISGDYIGAIAISEPNAGSDALAMSSTAILDDDHYILNGQKIWITNGPDADLAVVYAKTDPNLKHHGISAFVVNLNDDNISRSKAIDKLGMRGSNTGALYFDHVKVPIENRLGSPNQGLSVLMQGLDLERVMLAAGPIGIQQACLDLALEYAHQREQFDAPLITFQLTQAKIADMYTRLEASRAFLKEALALSMQNKLSSAYAASAYLHCSRSAVTTSQETVQILGGNGYTTDYQAEMFMRDAKLFDIGGGTNEIRQLIIAKELIKDFKN